MTHFTTDKQTLDDLNIFGKRGGDSIFAIYDHTLTNGGARILKEMFRYPLADEERINERSALIQCFAGFKIVFPIKNEPLEAAELYLSDTDERTMLAAHEHSLAKRLTNIVATDPAYKVIYKGITSLFAIMQAIRDFTLLPQIIGAKPYMERRIGITRVLKDPAFEDLLGESPRAKIDHQKIVEYDKLLRFRQRDKIRILLQEMYQLDVYLSIAKVAIERKFVFPVALPKASGTLLLEGVYHPKIKDAVANTIQMTPRASLIFLTGANMAGKSTFMKSFGTAMFLGHMGFPVAAQRMEFAVRDGIYTTINLPDNLSAGASHFYAEVLRIKKVAKEIGDGKRLFVIFDELFRGTNVKDAYEATIAITSAFAKQRNNMFVISTHIIEAGEVLKEQGNISFNYLPTTMNGTNPVYSYTLRNGITDDRHGMIIINNEGIIEMLRNNAPKNGQHELYNR